MVWFFDFIQSIALAFAPQFAPTELATAESVAIAAAMAVIALGCLVDGPIVIRFLITGLLNLMS
jgi:Na+/glutamate symporter